MRTRRATARRVELLDDLHACADLTVVKPKHEMADSKCQKSEVRRQRSEDRGLKTDVGGQIAEDRGLKTDVGDQMTDDGRRKTEDERKRVRG